MKKEFYIGQPLIIKETSEQGTLVYDDKYGNSSYSVLIKERSRCYIGYYEFDELEPSPFFKFSELMTGLEQGYFEVGTTFRRLSTDNVLTVQQSYNGIYLNGGIGLPSLSSAYIHSTWILVGDRKEMTLEEIEDELGYKIKLKENSDKPLPMDWI